MSKDFSDDEGLDEFEESVDERAANKKHGNISKFQDKPYDEAYEVSQDLSMAESFDATRMQKEREKKLQNDKYDEAMEVSMSVDQASPMKANTGVRPSKPDYEAKGQPGQQLLNKPFDEEHEFSGSDESIDTVTKNQDKHISIGKGPGAIPGNASHPYEARQQPRPADMAKPAVGPSSSAPAKQLMSPSKAQSKRGDDDVASEGEAEESAEGESYENIEGAYNPADYNHLNVTAEVRDLFQYIERYKPQEVELLTTLKCFIPEYIPTIGEMDAFIKIPRPDDKDDDLGLKFLDEPCSNQSDPTVLELQLRAMTKKVQYGDLVVRSIEDAHKNPLAIERWIQSISDLHRSKPPPQVHYRKPMPEIEELMEVWPEEFEALLSTVQLPSPELDVTLSEYAKILCSLLGIPTYDNPIESLHVMFSLYTDFRNNPHFQAQAMEADLASGEKAYGYGGADVMEINQGLK